MFTENTTYDQISADQNGNISVRRADQVLKDGAVISQTYHRHVLSPGADLSEQDARVQAIAEAIWTPEVIAAYQASLS